MNPLLAVLIVLLIICCCVWLINALGVDAATKKALSIAVAVVLLILLVCAMLGAFPGNVRLFR